MGELWWEQVSNAKRLIETIVKKLTEGKSVIACLPDNLPYPKVFEKIVKNKLTYMFSSMELVEIDLESDPIENVGVYMLNRFCKQTKRIQYRGSKTVATFLAESSDIVFHNRYFWIKNIQNEETMQEWVDFINDYNKHLADKLDRAVFILETNNEDLLKFAKGFVAGQSFDAEISDYDRYAFCTAIAADTNCKLSMRDYLGQLVASIAGEDVELCAECMARSKDFLSNPINALKNIQATKSRSNDQIFDIPLDKNSLEEKIWIAQIRTVFPVVERARVKYIKTYFEQLTRIISTNNIKVANEVVKNPYDLELGTLIYLCGINQLMIPTSEYDKIKMYRDARNDMAHQIPMNYASVERILSSKF